MKNLFKNLLKKSSLTVKNNKMETPKQDTRFTDEQYEQLEKAFQACDVDGSGSISKSELMAACQKSPNPVTKGQIDFVFSTIDSDHSGQIDFKEFLNFVYLSQFPQTEAEEAKLVFDGFDLDGSGSISMKELENACSKLGVNITGAQLEHAYFYIDGDGNGNIDFMEFLTFYQMLKQSQSA